MRRLELAHLLRSCCAIAGDNEVLVVGSQAILGTYDESALPEFVTLSREADSKLVAGRDKDFAFAASLIDAELVDFGVLVDRAGLLPVSGARVTAWLWACQRRRT